MHARITIEDTAMFADPSGALYWPETKTLVVADLHLEKGSAFAAKGVLTLRWVASVQAAGSSGPPASR